jgi:hypothetical protein
MKKKVSIVGGGTAGLILAAFLDTEKFEVTIFEKKASLGRKFLVAGDGGFNLTHAEDLSIFKTRYTPAGYFDTVLDEFTNVDFGDWLFEIGIKTFVGSSERVFPEEGIKPIDVLKKIETYILDNKVKLEFNKTFTGWDADNALEFNSTEIVSSDYVVFAMGGASWQVTGSDGSWLDLFKEKGIATLPFQPANCAYQIEWPEKFIQRNEGKPLKNIAFSIDGQTQKGEVVVTKLGIEGNAIYALSPKIQAQLDLNSEAVVYADFKPTLTVDSIIKKLTQSKTNATTTLREILKLGTTEIDLIKPALTKEEFLDIPTLANIIKKFPLKIIGAASIEEAISTCGGVALKAVKPNFEFKKLKNQFCIGEMLDWNAPTGGYLIQGCVSMGVWLGREMNEG